MKLAIQRGISHREFLETTNAIELAELKALNSIDPIFVTDRIDLAAQAICTTIYNMLRSGDSDPIKSDWPDHSAWITKPLEEQRLSDEFDMWRKEVDAATT